MRNDDDFTRGGISGFLRSLLAGIPWSETAQGEEELHFDPPAGGVVRLHNASGRTTVIGEDRVDIAMIVTKTARAESSDAADRLLQQQAVVAPVVGQLVERRLAPPDDPDLGRDRGAVQVQKAKSKCALRGA